MIEHAFTSAPCTAATGHWPMARESCSKSAPQGHWEVPRRRSPAAARGLRAPRLGLPIHVAVVMSRTFTAVSAVVLHAFGAAVIGQYERLLVLAFIARRGPVFNDNLGRLLLAQLHVR